MPFRPQDATTNPSLLLKAAQQPQSGRWRKRRSTDAVIFLRRVCLVASGPRPSWIGLAVNFGLPRFSRFVQAGIDGGRRAA